MILNQVLVWMLTKQAFIQLVTLIKSPYLHRPHQSMLLSYVDICIIGGDVYKPAHSVSVGWEPVTVWGQPINLLTVLHHSFCFPPLCHGFNFDIKSISIHAKSGNEAPHLSAVQRCWFAYLLQKKKEKSIWQIIIIPFFIHCPLYLTAALSSQGWNLTLPWNHLQSFFFLLTQL